MASAHHPPPLTPELLELLRCPESGQALAQAPAEIITILNAERTESIEGGLLREDGKLLYPIVGGFPLLVASEAIAIDKTA